ncbi:MAG: MBL fold metallo-hydrolase [Lachnospiraceae bacterium]|nr:MBL fold metallo-hydrolase [Lachnospiraceae bacterium]
MKKRIRRVVSELFVAFGILLAGWKAAEGWLESSARKNSLESSAELHFIDVGQGMAVLVESEGEFMLVDGGGYESADSLLAYLKTEGVDELEYLVISHYDLDHLYGAVCVLEEYEVEQVLCPEYEADSETWKRFRAVAASREAERRESGEEPLVRHPEPGDDFALGHSVFTVVSPVQKNYAEENNFSLGIRLVYGDVSFLMMGDAEIESEYDVCDSGLELKSTVYMVNHHGSNSSSSQQLLKAVRPEFAVISCGLNNDYGHPAERVLERLQEFGVIVYRTDRQGSILAVTDGEKIEWSVEEEWN